MKTLLTIIIAFLFASCGWKRKMQKSEVKADSASVQKIDSSWLKSFIEKTQYSKQSGREIITIPAQVDPRYDSMFRVLLGRDYKNDPDGRQQILREIGKLKAATPIYYPQQPIIIDRTFSNETGSQETQTKDSGAYYYADSVLKRIESQNNDVKSSFGLSVFQWIILGVLAAAIAFIVYLLLKKKPIVEVVKAVKSVKKKPTI